MNDDWTQSEAANRKHIVWRFINTIIKKFTMQIKVQALIYGMKYYII